MIVIAQDGETLDALVWRVLGRTAGIVEQALACNPALTALPARLPGGTRVDLTQPAEIASAASPRETISLWD